MYRLFIKRTLDVIASFTGLLLVSPIFLIILVIMFFSNKGKPFFLQVRPGKNEKFFTILKLKTMNDKRDSNGELLSDEKRLTAIGRFIRKTSMDEIPQLINVLKGDMSLIGPRPLLVEYIELYNIEQRKRHDVRPGITGWAQVNGRNSIDWIRKFELDVYYVENMSFGLDLKILFKTIMKVIKSEDIAAEGSVTVGRFKGNDL